MMKTQENLTDLLSLTDKLENSWYKCKVYTVIGEVKDKTRLFELNTNSSETIPIDMSLPSTLSANIEDIILIGGYYFNGERYVIERYINLTSNRIIIEKLSGLFNNDSNLIIRRLFHHNTLLYSPLFGLLIVFLRFMLNTINVEIPHKNPTVKSSASRKELAIITLLQITSIVLLYFLGINTLFYYIFPASFIALGYREFSFRKLRSQLQDYETNFCNMYQNSIHECLNNSDINTKSKAIHSKLGIVYDLKIDRANIAEADINKTHTKEFEADNVKISSFESTEAKLGEIKASTVSTETIESKKVYAEEANLEEIEAGTVNTDTIESKRINAEEANLVEIEVSAIDTETIESKKINGEEASLGKIEASIINTDTVESKRINVEEASFGEINANTIDTEMIKSNQLNITSNDYKNNTKQKSTIINQASKKRVSKAKHDRIKSLLLEGIELEPHDTIKNNSDLWPKTKNVNWFENAKNELSKLINELRKFDKWEISPAPYRLLKDPPQDKSPSIPRNKLTS